MPSPNIFHQLLLYPMKDISLESPVKREMKPLISLSHDYGKRQKPVPLINLEERIVEQVIEQCSSERLRLKFLKAGKTLTL